MYSKSLLFLANFGGTGIVIVLFIIFLFFLPTIFYCLTLKKTFLEISYSNRKMPADNVWLLLIPLFSLVWNFIVVNKMTESLSLEFQRRNIKVSDPKPGFTIGIAYCILACCGLIPVIGVFLSIGGFVCWIIYWVKINEFYNLLRKHGNNDMDKISEIGNGIL